jgi:hypothetical protein
MKNHTFKIINEDDGQLYNVDQLFPSVDMSIPSEASLSDMLYAFERFLEATGYALPENSVLDFVEQDQ